MQHTDPAWQRAADANNVFERAQQRHVWWVTGTEVDDRAAAVAHGYTYWTSPNRDVWIAIDPIRATPGTTSWTWTPIIPGVAHRHPTRGVLRVTFRNPQIGWVTVIASHYNLRDPSNAPIAAAINRKTLFWGRGARLVFFGGDTNMHLRFVDPFFGAPLTTAWAQLGHFEPTHYYRETIDTVASFDGDGRPRAAYCHARNDAFFPLYSDHFMVAAGYDVPPL